MNLFVSTALTGFLSLVCFGQPMPGQDQQLESLRETAVQLEGILRHRNFDEFLKNVSPRPLRVGFDYYVSRLDLEDDFREKDGIVFNILFGDQTSLYDVITKRTDVKFVASLQRKASNDTTTGRIIPGDYLLNSGTILIRWDDSPTAEGFTEFPSFSMVFLNHRWLIGAVDF